jgi:hypothetical protein
LSAASRHVRHALALAFLATSPAVAAEAPCPPTLFEKESAESGPRTAQGAAEARRHLEMVANVQLMYQGCAIGDAAFTAKFKPLYDEWRAKYRDAFSSYERNTRARRYVQCGLEQEKRRAEADSPAARTERAQLCNQMIGPGIQRFIDHGPR